MPDLAKFDASGPCGICQKAVIQYAIDQFLEYAWNHQVVFRAMPGAEIVLRIQTYLEYGHPEDSKYCTTQTYDPSLVSDESYELYMAYQKTETTEGEK